MTESIDKVEQFKAEASRAGAKVKEFTDPQDVAPFIINLAQQHNAKHAVITSSPLVSLLELKEKLEGEGMVVTVGASSDSETAQRRIRQACIEADIGISEATVAISETGTLVIASDNGIPRLIAVLPRIHITLIDHQNIVTSLEEAGSRIKAPGNPPESPTPTYVTYITGRNTTADIPGALLARAQGPAEEHILLVPSQLTR